MKGNAELEVTHKNMNLLVYKNSKEIKKEMEEGGIFLGVKCRVLTLTGKLGEDGRFGCLLFQLSVKDCFCQESSINAIFSGT